MNRAHADVLLADDSPADAELVAECLASVVAPRRIHRVCDGVEALDFLFCRGPVDFDRFREAVGDVGRFWLGTNEPAPAAPGEPGP